MMFKRERHDMKHTNLHIIVFGLLLCLIVEVAYAGPIRDWLSDRKAGKPNIEQQDAELSLDDESAAYAVLPQGVRVLKDVAYGNESEQRMDVYLPAYAKNAPMILMVHGGAWRFGDKAANSVVQHKVARWVSRGFIFISANYRLLPKAKPLAQADDVAQALAAVQANAAIWGGDPVRLILMGHSAGAHLVALISAAPEKAKYFGARRWLGTVSLDSAAMHVVQIMQAKHYRFYDQAFGKDVLYWKSASPFHVLTANAMPMLLVCSSTRTDKPCEQAKSFAAKAGALGTRVEISEQAMSHKEINQTLGLPGSYTDAVDNFMGSLDVSVHKMLFDN